MINLLGDILMPSPPPSIPSPAESPSAWLASLGITGVNPSLLLAAFTHPSYRALDSAAESYERLEFIGDAVLGLMVGEILFHSIPDASEGVLTERRAAVVNKKALAADFDRIELVRFIRASPGYVPSPKDKANVVEALFGAVFVGRDFATCRMLWQSLAFSIPPLPGSEIPRAPSLIPSPAHVMYQEIYQSLGIPLTAPHNAKNALQQLCQKQGLRIPTYEELPRTGPQHNRIYHVRLALRPFTRDPDLVFEATGQGSSLKEAEIQAAARLCDQIGLPYTPQ